MSTTIKSNSDGSAAIQTGGVDRVQITTGGNIVIPGSLSAGTLENFTGSNQLVASSGYQKLPGGLIIQWGNSATTSGGGTALNLPTPFLTSVYSFTATPNIAVGASAAFLNIDITTSTLSTLNIFARNQSNTAYLAVNYFWIAIGK